MDRGVECEGLEQGPAGERLRGEERREEREETLSSQLEPGLCPAPPDQTGQTAAAPASLTQGPGRPLEPHIGEAGGEDAVWRADRPVEVVVREAGRTS